MMLIFKFILFITFVKLIGASEQNRKEFTELFNTYFVLICPTKHNFVTCHLEEISSPVNLTLRRLFYFSTA